MTASTHFSKDAPPTDVTPTDARAIVLASQSPYRRQLLTQLNLPFVCDAPHIDETPLANETAHDLVARLAIAKAKTVAARHPQSLIIGSDQVADLNGKILGKPRDHNDAVNQLRAQSNNKVTMHVGVALYDARTQTVQSTVELFYVWFRQLDAHTIESYLAAQQPYNCCGSLKAEGLGIALLSKLNGDDPNALIGLPLIRLIDFLQNVNVRVL